MTITDVLRDAASWTLLGQLFECPHERWRIQISHLAEELADDAFTKAVEAVGSDATEGQYHSVFGPGGPASPREATYHDTLELGSLMSELSAFYQGFAYSSGLDEPPDHIAVELGFVGYLRLKQAYAMAAGDDEHATVASLAAERFIADHLAISAVPLARTLRTSHLDYLVRAAEILARRVGVRPAAVRLPMLQQLSDDDQDMEFHCGV
jgi:TorA maturation chaperone TorD